MVNNISWASYLYAISIILVIYYAFVLILYYRYDLQKNLLKFKTRFNPASANRDASPENEGIEIPKVLPGGNDQNNSIGELLLSLQSLIKNGAARNFPREELLLSLQLKLQHYEYLKDSILKDSINNFIISECKNYCSMHLSVDEVSALWIN